MCNFGVIAFPGSNCDRDCVRALEEILGKDVKRIWHTEAHLRDLDAVLIPGGFSYGDYLRPGAIARFSPIMRAVGEFAQSGGLVLGICNGFQILLEAGLLPGALLRNRSLKFICRNVTLESVRKDTPFSGFDEKKLSLPIAHGQGRYYIDEDGLRRLKENNQIVFRYSTEGGEENPNGSVDEIAGIINEQGNVLGMMPHPERACREKIGGVDHGRWIFRSMIGFLSSDKSRFRGMRVKSEARISKSETSSNDRNKNDQNA